MQHILIILLGCNIYSILMNRLETSFKYIEFIHHNSIKNKNNLIDIYPDEIAFENRFMGKLQPKQTQITWFLSGGIKNNHLKNNHSGAKSEASIMKSHIDDYINMKFQSGSSRTNSNSNSKGTNIQWDFVLDELSTNTAENFIRASDFLNKTSISFDSVYIVTSDFHHKRASMMINLIDPSRQYKWILGDMELSDSRRWEEVHIQNVHSDVSKAFGMKK